MKRLKTIFIALLLALSVQSGWAQGKVVLHHSIYNGSAFLPANGTYNWGGITHLIMFGSLLSSNASINYCELRNPAGPTYLNNIIAEAHSNNVKVLMCLAGNEYSAFFAATTDSAHCQTVVDAIMTTYYDAYDWDGIDLDWEGSFPADKWMLLSRIFRTALDARTPRGLLFADIGRGPSSSQPIWFINQFYDNVQPMVYDNNGWYSYSSGFHNPLGNARLDYPAISPYDVDIAYGTAYATQALENFAAQGMDKSKMTVGVALYPHVWHNFSPPVYQPGMPTTKGGVGSACIGNCEGLDNWSTAVYPRILAGYEQHYAPNAAMGWMGNQAEGWYMNYPTAQTFAAFNAYVADSGWGGVMLFESDHQYFFSPIEWPIGSGTFTRNPLLDDFRASLNPVAPTITTQPSNVSTYVGNTATVTVSATGNGAYQWQKNSVNISGAISSSYTTPTLVIGDNGNQYRCIISNSVGTVTSNQAILTVTNSLPVISVHPANTTKSAGQTATFSVTANGTLPLSYQWQKREFAGSYVTISGAISSSYTTAALQTSDNATSFRCIISNSIGTATSNAGMLTVLASVAPTSDDFHTGSLNTSLWTLTNPASASTISFEGAGTRDAVFKIAIPAGTAYDGNGSPCIMQNISNVDFGLETKVQNAIQPLANYVSSGFLIRGGSDYIRILFAYNATTASIYGATYISGITSQVVNTSITNAPVLYMRLVRVGNLWTVTHSYDGSSWFTSGSFTLAFTVESVGLHVSNCCGGTSPAITGTFDYFFNTASPIADEDPTTGDPPAILTQPTNVSGNVGATVQFSVTATNSPTYQWTKNSVNISGATNSTYTTPALVYATDNGAAFRCIVSNASGTVSSNEAILTVNVPVSITMQPTAVTIDSNNTATFSIEVAGTSPFAYQWQKNTVNISGEITNSYSLFSALPSDSGASFRCIVSNAAGTVTSNSVLLHVKRTAPNILSNPSNLSVVEGDSASFTVTASGKAPYFLQWQKNGVDIAGATSLSYTTPALVIGDNGNTYRCRAFSGYGNDTSGSATLTVTAAPDPDTAPTITSQPTNQSVVVGQTATFTVGATGTAPLAYQWQKNTVNISAATLASYTTPVTVIGDDGDEFRCVVSNGTGTATSNAATLTVTTPPDTTQPSLVLQTPVSGQIMLAGTTETTTALISNVIQVVAKLLPEDVVLGTWPDISIGGGSGEPVGTINIGIRFSVPYETGDHRIVLVGNGGELTDTSDTFIISANTVPSIILVSNPTNRQIGTRQYVEFQYSTNADSVALFYKRDTDANYQTTVNNRNIAPNKNFNALWGGFIAYPLSRDLELRLYAWLNGAVNYQQVRIEILR